MKKFTFILLTFFSIWTATAQQELKKITFTPNWGAQAQFAGYYVAYEKGFYKEAGLDVTIKHPNILSRHSALDMIESGETDIISQFLLEVIPERAKGFNLVNFLQVSQNSGLVCVANREIPTIKSLDGLTLSRWKSDFFRTAYLAIHKNNVNVNWIYSMSGPNLFISGAVDATLCYSFNEYLQLYFAKGFIPKENVLRFSEQGFNYPEDGLYCTEEFYNANKEDVKKFAEASIRGWEYARTHKDEALEITFKYINATNGLTSVVHQKMMLEIVLRLQEDAYTQKATYAPVSENLFNKIIVDMKKAGLAKQLINYKDFIK